MKYEIKIRMLCDPGEEDMYFNALIEDLKGVEYVQGVKAYGTVIEIESATKKIATLKAVLKPIFSRYFHTVRVIDTAVA